MNGKRGCDDVRTKRRSAALQEVASGTSELQCKESSGSGRRVSVMRGWWLVLGRCVYPMHCYDGRQPSEHSRNIKSLGGIFLLTSAANWS